MSEKRTTLGDGLRHALGEVHASGEVLTVELRDRLVADLRRAIEAIGEPESINVTVHLPCLGSAEPAPHVVTE